MVKVGELTTGAVVRVTIRDEPALSYGHLTPANVPDASDNETTIGVTIISQLGNTALSVRHFGLRDPVTIRPDWIDIAISSPLLLAMAALFSLLASVGQILVLGLGRQGEADKQIGATDLT